MGWLEDFDKNAMERHQQVADYDAAQEQKLRDAFASSPEIMADFQRRIDGLMHRLGLRQAPVQMPGVNSGPAEPNPYAPPPMRGGMTGVRG